MSTSFIIAQAIGCIAFAVGLAGYAQTQDQRVRIIMGAQGLIAALHFFMLGRYSGAFSAGISGLRNFASLHGKLKILTVPFIIFYVVLGLYGYKAWFDLLPIFASTLSTYNYFYLEGRMFRVNLILVSALWFVHNVFALSWALMAMEFLMVIIGIKTYLKLYGKTKPT